MLAKKDKQLIDRELSHICGVYKVALQLLYKNFQVCNKPILILVINSAICLCNKIESVTFSVSQNCIIQNTLIISYLQSQVCMIQKYKLFGRNYITPTLLIKVSFY